MPQLLVMLRRCARERAGVAAVEFAILAPVMIVLLGAAVDIGFAIERSIRLENAARTAAQYATQSPNNLSGARDAAQATISDLAGATVQMPTLACLCPDATGQVSGTPSSGNCGTSCPNGLARYVTVTVTCQASSAACGPIFPTSALIPFNNIGDLTSNVVARIQ